MDPRDRPQSKPSWPNNSAAPTPTAPRCTVTVTNAPDNRCALRIVNQQHIPVLDPIGGYRWPPPEPPPDTRKPCWKLWNRKLGNPPHLHRSLNHHKVTIFRYTRAQFLTAGGRTGTVPRPGLFQAHCARAATPWRMDTVVTDPRRHHRNLSIAGRDDSTGVVVREGPSDEVGC